jgi:hypothetical protein
LPPLRQGQHALEKQAADPFVQQAVAVGAEGGVIPNRVIQRQADEPAVEQVEVDVLHQLPLGAARKQDLQQTGAKQAFRWNGIPAAARIQGVERLIQRSEQEVDHCP